MDDRNDRRELLYIKEELERILYAIEEGSPTFGIEKLEELYEELEQYLKTKPAKPTKLSPPPPQQNRNTSRSSSTPRGE